MLTAAGTEVRAARDVAVKFESRIKLKFARSDTDLAAAGDSRYMYTGCPTTSVRPLRCQVEPIEVDEKRLPREVRRWADERKWAGTSDAAGQAMQTRSHRKWFSTG